MHDPYLDFNSNKLEKTPHFLSGNCGFANVDSFYDIEGLLFIFFLVYNGTVNILMSVSCRETY